MRLHKVGRVTSMGRKWRWEGNKHTEPLNLSIVADVALDGALKRELVNFLLLLPTRSAQTRRVSDCFRLSRLTLGSNIHDKLLNTGSWGLEVGYMHIPNYPSCFGWGGFFVWWGLIGAALLHIEIIGRRRCQGVTFKETPWTPLLDGSDGSAWRASLARGCPEAQCPRCPLSTTYQVVLQSKRSLKYFKTFQVSRQRIIVFCASEELLVRQSFMKETQNKTPPWERRSGLGHNASHGSFYCWPPSRFEINISSFTNGKYV